MQEYLEKTLFHIYSDWSKVEYLKETDYKHLHISIFSPAPENRINEVLQYANKFDKVSIHIGHSADDKYDLSFLQHFPHLYSFSLRAHLFTDFEQVKFIPEGIKKLGIGATNSLRLSLGFLSQFKSLQELSIEAHKKDHEVISELKGLRRLALRSITLPDLNVIQDLSELKKLEIRLGGTKNLSVLPNLTKLEYLELWRINKIENIDVISEICNLKKIHLEQMRNVKNVSSLEKLSKLKRLALFQMKGLSSLEWASDAPALEELIVSDANQLTSDNFLPFVNHQSLRSTKIHIGAKDSLKVNQMLNLG